MKVTATFFALLLSGSAWADREIPYNSGLMNPQAIPLADVSDVADHIGRSAILLCGEGNLLGIKDIVVSFKSTDLTKVEDRGMVKLQLPAGGATNYSAVAVCK